MAVSRMFSNAEDAAAAVDELQAAEFAPVGIHVVNAGSGPATARDLVARGVTRARAETYAERIAHGGTMVLVDTPLGTARLAQSILGKRRGADTDAVETHYEMREGTDDPAAPLSSALDLPVLSRDPAPLSAALGLAVLATWPVGKGSSFGIPLLSREPALLSSLLGLKPLWRKAAPLSDRPGLKVLWGRAAPLSDRIGLKVLSRTRAPLSSLLGLPLLTGGRSVLGPTRLSRDPAPLSSLLGLRVLTRGRSKRP